MPDAGIGHNTEDITFEVEVRLFNALARRDGGTGRGRRMTVAPGATVGDIASRLGLETGAVHLILVNGRDITGGLVGDPVRRTYAVEQGDVIAFSGPVPYSYGYGAPVI